MVLLMVLQALSIISLILYNDYPCTKFRISSTFYIFMVDEHCPISAQLLHKMIFIYLCRHYILDNILLTSDILTICLLYICQVKGNCPMPYTLRWGMWTECRPIIADGADGKSHRYLVTATELLLVASVLGIWTTQI